MAHVQGQGVGINSTGANPDASAKLDIVSSNKGFLIPRVALTATNAAGPITSPATGLMVYNTATAGTSPNNVTPGFYYWNVSQWVRFQDVVATDDWHLLGNSGTVDGTNFVGTTDNIGFNLKVNNSRSGRIGIATDGSNFLGYQAGNGDNLANKQNSFIGYQSGLNARNTLCTALGYQACLGDSVSLITAVGSYAGRNYFNKYDDDYEYYVESVAFGDSTLAGRTEASGGYYFGANSCAFGWGSQANVYYRATRNATFGFKTIFSIDEDNGIITGNNSAFGYSAARMANLTAQKVAIGPYALDSVYGYHAQVAIGDHALGLCAWHNNVAIGDHAFCNASEGSSGVCIGNNVLKNFNTYNAGENTTMGNNNYFSTIGSSYHSAFGHDAAYAVTNNSPLDLLGYKAATNLTDPNVVVAIGKNAFNGKTTSYQWLTTSGVAFGDSTLFSVIGSNTWDSTSYSNTVQGHKALFKNAGGKFNTVFGSNALMEITMGYSNIAYGYNAGRFITDGTTANDYSRVGIYVGSNTKALNHYTYNEVVIGYNATGFGDNSLTIGNGSTAITALKGKVGAGVETPFHRYNIPDITAPTSQLDIQNNSGTGYNQLRIETPYTPTSGADTNGNVGDIAWDNNYLYIKTPTGWKRRVLSTW